MFFFPFILLIEISFDLQMKIYGYSSAEYLFFPTIYALIMSTLSGEKKCDEKLKYQQVKLKSAALIRVMYCCLCFMLHLMI